MTLPTATLGRTGETVTKLGYGAMELRSRKVDPADADRVLNAVLDAGINLIDTSPDYGASEEHIGRGDRASSRRVLPREQVRLPGR